MDAEVVVARLCHGDKLVHQCLGHIRIQCGRLYHRGGHGICRGFRAHLHLQALKIDIRRAVGVDGEAVGLAGLQADGGRDEPVVAIVVTIILV